MSTEVAKDLSKRNLLAHTIRVKFRTPDFTTFTRQRSLEVGTDNEETIYRLALAIWIENWPAGRPMRLLGVGAASLVEGEGRQLGLFLREENLHAKTQRTRSGEEINHPQIWQIRQILRGISLICLICRICG